MEFAPVSSPDDLISLPDGTLVVWQRIAGDPTSMAVAFLHYERDDSGGVTYWLSPGGWDPMGLEVIEHWNTAKVLVRVENEDGPEPADGPYEGSHVGPPLLPPRTDEDFRDRALSLAVQVMCSRQATTTTNTLDRAAYFETYLRGGAQ